MTFCVTNNTSDDRLQSLAYAVGLTFEIVFDDELADESDRYELHTDDDHGHTEECQGSLTDIGEPHEPLDGQPQIGHESNDRKQRSKEAEEVQRTLDVARGEHDREQVKEALEKSTRTKLAVAELPCMMLNRDLGNAEAFPVSQGGNVSMHLAIDLDRLDHVAPIRFESAIEVVKLDTGHDGRDSIEQLRRHGLVPWIVSLALPSGDKVMSLFELRDQCRNFIGVILKVCIHRDDDIAFNLGEGYCKCCALAIVSTESDSAKTRITIVQTVDHFERRVGRSIIYEHHVPPSRCDPVEHRFEPTGEFTK